MRSMRAGVLETGPGARHGLETVGFDLPATDLTRPVGAFVDLAESGVEVADLGLELFEDGEVLLPFERLGADVTLVLIGRRELGNAVAFALRSDSRLGL